MKRFLILLVMVLLLASCGQMSVPPKAATQSDFPVASFTPAVAPEATVEPTPEAEMMLVKEGYYADPEKKGHFVTEPFFNPKWVNLSEYRETTLSDEAIAVLSEQFGDVDSFYERAMTDGSRLFLFHSGGTFIEIRMQREAGLGTCRVLGAAIENGEIKVLVHDKDGQQKLLSYNWGGNLEKWSAYEGGGFKTLFIDHDNEVSVGEEKYLRAYDHNTNVFETMPCMDMANFLLRLQGLATP